jgi:sec-independent protein translocase protein TatB
MFNVTGGELVIILLLALMVLGPQRLPQAARTIGKVMAQIRDVSSSFQRELKDAFEDVTDPVTKPASRPQLTALDGGGAGPPGVPATMTTDAAPEGLAAEPAPTVVDDAAPEAVLLDAAEPTPPGDAAGLVMPTTVGTVDGPAPAAGTTATAGTSAPRPVGPETEAPPVRLVDQGPGGRQDS